MNLTVSELLRLPHASQEHLDAIRDRPVTGVSTDSRKVSPGEVFFALKGNNVDGHQFVAQAIADGATAAVVDASSPHASRTDLPLLRVADSTRALGQLAALYRSKFSLPVLAIAGSNGKTTTKEMITRVLGTTYNVLSTEGNFNNHIGVPRTLFRLSDAHEIAVVEVGTNHPGEVEALCRILQPTHGLITTIGREHLEYFKTVEGVAEEEGMLFRYLEGKKSAVALVNADDSFVVAQAAQVRKRIRYGFVAKPVTVRGKVLSCDERACVTFLFKARDRHRATNVHLGIPGEHNAVNALAAAAVGLLFDVPARTIRDALEGFRPASKRMEIFSCGDVLILNDTYNSNPDSAAAALRTLARVSVGGKRIAVLADMRELGSQAPAEHAALGREATVLGVDYLLTYGASAKHIHDAAGLQNRFHYEQKNMLAEYLLELVSPGDAVLVKGSRGMQMEDIVTFLQERLCRSVPSLRPTGTV